MKTNNPYTPFDEQLREQLASLDPEVPEGVWEAMESSLDALNQNLQFDAVIRETVEQVNIPAPEGVFQAVQSQLGSGIFGSGLSIAGKWILGSVLAGVVATSVWFVAVQKEEQAMDTITPGTEQKEEVIIGENAEDKQANKGNILELELPASENGFNLASSGEISTTYSSHPQEYPPVNTPNPSNLEAAPGATNNRPQDDDSIRVRRPALPKTPVFGFSRMDTLLCEGQTYKLFLLNADNCVYEVWINGSCHKKGIKGNQQTEYPMTTTGLFHIECRILDGETIHKKEQYVYINPLPEVKLNKSDIGGGRYVFEATEGVKTSWYLDGGKTLNGYIQLYDALPKDHRMTAQVTNKFGCTDSASLEFRNNFVFEVKEPIIPNVFTPDGDGKNDVYTVELEGATHYQIYIFNSRSQLVFESTDPKAGWDGKDKYKQNRIESGTYTCIIDYALAGGEIKRVTKKIELIKE